MRAEQRRNESRTAGGREQSRRETRAEQRVAAGAEAEPEAEAEERRRGRGNGRGVDAKTGRVLCDEREIKRELELWKSALLYRSA